MLHRCPAAVLQAGIQIPVARAGEYFPPAVEDPGNVFNPVRFFRNPEKEIMVLAAVKSAAQAAGFLQQVSADYSQMADIVIADQVIRAVIRFVMGIHMPSAVLCNTVFIGIDHIRLLFLYPLCHLPQGIGAEQVIMVAEGYVFTAGILYRFIGVSADTLVFFSADYPETGFRTAPALQDPKGFSPGACVVQDCFKILITLVPEAVQQCAEHTRIRIIYRYYHADQPRVRLVFPLFFQF